MKKTKRTKIHPILMCLILIAVVVVVSGIGDALGLQTSYYHVNPITGKMESQLVEIDSIFNRTGIQYMVSNMISNFINFAPLGTLIVGLLGVGVAYKSGFLTTLFKLIKKNVSRKLITFLIGLRNPNTTKCYTIYYPKTPPFRRNMCRFRGHYLWLWSKHCNKWPR